jgi:hypothetical protein
MADILCDQSEVLVVRSIDGYEMLSPLTQSAKNFTVKTRDGKPLLSCGETDKSMGQAVMRVLECESFNLDVYAGATKVCTFKDPDGIPADTQDPVDQKIKAQVPPSFAGKLGALCADPEGTVFGMINDESGWSNMSYKLELPVGKAAFEASSGTVCGCCGQDCCFGLSSVCCFPMPTCCLPKACKHMELNIVRDGRDVATLQRDLTMRDQFANAGTWQLSFAKTGQLSAQEKLGLVGLVLYIDLQSAADISGGMDATDALAVGTGAGLYGTFANAIGGDSD